jgi:hypothetical protein
MTRGITLEVSAQQKPVARRSDPEARRAYTRWHYRQNKQAYKARAVAHRRAAGAEIMQFITRFKMDNPCIDCGEGDPVVLDFDHRPGEIKSFTIGSKRMSGMCLAAIQKEIEKCDVRCSNCHRRMTHKRREEVRVCAGTSTGR